MSTSNVGHPGRTWIIILSIAMAFALLLGGVGGLSAQEDNGSEPTPESLPITLPSQGDTTPAEEPTAPDTSSAPDQTAEPEATTEPTATAEPSVTPEADAGEDSDDLTPDEIQAADLSQSSKSAEISEAAPGDTVGYTLIISNTGVNTASDVFLTDPLPTGIDYISGTLSLATTGLVSGSVYGFTDNVLTFEAQHIGSFGSATLTFDVLVDEMLTDGTIITNVATISDTSSMVMVDATFAVVVEPETTDSVVFLPAVYKPLSAPTLNPIGRPNSNNQWLVSWQYSGGDGVTFTVQESQDMFFGNPTETTVTATSLNVSHPLTADNVYYYRVRTNSGSLSSGWSNVHSVVTGYRDNFTIPRDWGMRRTTNLEEVSMFYENNDWLIIQTQDKWDWGIFSPLKQAPSLPYAVEYRSQAANLGNLLSHGAVFAADWNGEACPDYSSEVGLYQHTNCFNQFYNMNIINQSIFDYVHMKLVVENVGQLVWCFGDPGCTQSPMKRLSENYGNAVVDEKQLTSLAADGWNVYRYEVRDSGITSYVNGVYVTQTPVGSWNDEPYFGLFVSTDEYNNSAWRIDYMQVTPLDN